MIIVLHNFNIFYFQDVSTLSEDLYNSLVSAGVHVEKVTSNQFYCFSIHLKRSYIFKNVICNKSFLRCESVAKKETVALVNQSTACSDYEDFQQINARHLRSVLVGEHVKLILQYCGYDCVFCLI